MPLTRLRLLAQGLAATAAVAGVAITVLTKPAWAQGSGASASGFYSCTDARGRTYRSDRPIPQCADREQQLLNRDGSVRGAVGPSMTAEERAAYEEAQRRKLIAEAAHKDVVRHDRNLLARYPNAAAHARARESALEPTQLALQAAEARLVDLAKERKRLDTESEFYTGKSLPRSLTQQYEQNQAAAQAQQHSIEQHRAELTRVQATYDEELARLKKLWGGAQPGSVGPIPSPAKAASAAALNPAASSAAR